MAEDAWNTRDPERVALAYTIDSRWRNRTDEAKPLQTRANRRIAASFSRQAGPSRL
jgi:nuclear transport factor 2 (NTF2) superfamily protein